ncbi:MAG: ribonuclease J [Thermomicrobiales bacterium]
MDQSSDETRRKPRRNRRRRKPASELQQAPAAVQTPPQSGDSAQAAPSRQRKRQPRQKSKLPEQPHSAGGGPRGKLRIIPLGGVGEVGKNATVVEYENDLVLLDAGGKFPEEDQHAIDLVVPDVSYVRERINNLRAILITHGHEDHIGGLPFILHQLKTKRRIPVYGSPLAIGLIDAKLREHRCEKMVELTVVQDGERVELGKLAAEFVHVTHSIPDTNAIAIHTPIGTVVDTADFKFDPTPVMGKPTDERRLERIGNEGVLALLSDTVRVESEGSTPSERVVYEKILQVVKTAKGQIVLASFASNISRLKMALDAAEENGRVVAVSGRSMEQSSNVARELEYLQPRPGLLVTLDEALKMPPSKRMLVVTGSQGEPAAALSRIAMNEHPKIRVTAGDVVIVSATPVPGNEETVSRTIDNLFRRGATVVYSGIDRGVHVSGHAARDELTKMIKLVKPRFVVPIHGEYRHMTLYRDLARKAGIPADRVFFPEIGGVLEFSEDRVTQPRRVKSGTILVDRLGDRAAGRFVIRDPEKLDEQGLVIVSFVVRSDTSELIAGPTLTGKLLDREIDREALDAAAAELKRALERQSKSTAEYGYLARRAREVVGRSLYRKSKSRPLILPALTVI